ncbi:hypothetical protein G6F32_017050 [Rhizopus arrhizus]|nr:hypothetical protein G6F32_017050 [Rhizopus arrhizus]
MAAGGPLPEPVEPVRRAPGRPGRQRRRAYSRAGHRGRVQPVPRRQSHDPRRSGAGRRQLPHLRHPDREPRAGRVRPQAELCAAVTRSDATRTHLRPTV